MMVRGRIACLTALCLALGVAGALAFALVGGSTGNGRENAGASVSASPGPAGLIWPADEATLMIFAHQDDDLLWMQPLMEHSATLLLAVSPPAPAHRRVVARHPAWYQARWSSVFAATGTDQEWIDTFGLRDRCERDQEWNPTRIAEAIESWVADPRFRRILTHNNWGEYGHIHHRWLNQAVRDAAVRHGKDVWVLNTFVVFHLDEAAYLDLGDWGLNAIVTPFDHARFDALRAIYQSVEFEGTPSGLNTWTWSDGVDQYPVGSRTFVRIVEQGVDLTREDPRIRHLVGAVMGLVPVTGACEARAQASMTDPG